MQTVGKFAGLALALIALFLSAVNFLGPSPSANSDTPLAATYAQIFDSAEQASLALADEHLLTSISYGIDGPAPANFVKNIQALRTQSDAALGALAAFDVNASIPPYLADQLAKVQSSAQELVTLRTELDTDFTAAARTEKAITPRTIGRTFHALSNDLAEIERSLLFSDPARNTTDTALLHLRYNLLTMYDNSTREATSLGVNVSSGSSISDITKDRGSRLGGRTWAAWEMVQSIANAGDFQDVFTENLKATQQMFFDEYQEARFELYDLSDAAVDEASEDDYDVKVDYERSAEDWTSLHAAQAQPVLDMLIKAQKFSPAKPIAEKAPSQTRDAALLIATVGFSLLFLATLFTKGPIVAEASPNLAPVDRSTPVSLSQLAMEVRKLSERVSDIERSRT